MVDEIWLEAQARVQADLDADVRAEAAEVFRAEAARTRVEDHTGVARITVRCGHTIEGALAGAQSVTGHVALRDRDDRSVRIPVHAIVRISGSRPALRDESATGRSVTSWLREAWLVGDDIAALDCTGVWHRGVVDFVGADHVVLLAAGSAVTIPFHAVDAWRA